VLSLFQDVETTPWWSATVQYTTQNLADAVYNWWQSHLADNTSRVTREAKNGELQSLEQGYGKIREVSLILDTTRM